MAQLQLSAAPNRDVNQEALQKAEKKDYDKLNELSQSKDRAQMSASTAMSIVHVGLLKQILDAGTTGHKYYYLVLILIIVCLILQIMAGLISIFISQMKNFYSKYHENLCGDSCRKLCCGSCCAKDAGKPDEEDDVDIGTIIGPSQDMDMWGHSFMERDRPGAGPGLGDDGFEYDTLDGDFDRDHHGDEWEGVEEEDKDSEEGDGLDTPDAAIKNMEHDIQDGNKKENGLYMSTDSGLAPGISNQDIEIAIPISESSVKPHTENNNVKPIISKSTVHTKLAKTPKQVTLPPVERKKMQHIGKLPRAASIGMPYQSHDGHSPNANGRSSIGYRSSAPTPKPLHNPSIDRRYSYKNPSRPFPTIDHSPSIDRPHSYTRPSRFPRSASIQQPDTENTQRRPSRFPRSASLSEAMANKHYNTPQYPQRSFAYHRPSNISYSFAKDPYLPVINHEKPEDATAAQTTYKAKLFNMVRSWGRKKLDADLEKAKAEVELQYARTVIDDCNATLSKIKHKPEEASGSDHVDGDTDPSFVLSNLREAEARKNYFESELREINILEKEGQVLKRQADHIRRRKMLKTVSFWQQWLNYIFYTVLVANTFITAFGFANSDGEGGQTADNISATK